MARKSFYDSLQGYYNTNETVQTYANQLWPNGREAQWDEVQFEPMLYDMVWVELNADLPLNLKLFTIVNGKFNSTYKHIIPQLLLKQNRRSMASSTRSHRASNLISGEESESSDHQFLRPMMYL